MSTLLTLHDPVQAALAMIAPSWGVRARLVLVIDQVAQQEPDGWCRKSYRELAEMACISEGWVWQLLGSPTPAHPAYGSLWRVERVVLRGEKGRGTRATAYRVNLSVGSWRGVPWLVRDRHNRLLRIEVALLAQSRGTEGVGEAGQGGSVPRSSYRGTEGVSRRRSGVTKASSAAVANEKPRRNGRPPRHNGDPSAAVTGEDFGAKSSEGAPSSYTSFVSEEPPSSSGFKEEENGDLSDLLLALEERTQRPCRGPKLIARLGRIAEGADRQLLAEAIRRAPDGLMGWKVVDEWLPGVLDGRFKLDGENVGVGDNVHQLRGRLAALANEAAQYENNGYEVPEIVRERMADCQNEIERMEAAG